MAPSNFKIYVDQSLRQPASAPEPAPQEVVQAAQKPNQQPSQPGPLRFIPESWTSNQRFYFDERKLYPPTGEEFSFEELNLFAWTKRQNELLEKRRYALIERENEELRMRLDAANQQLVATTNALKELQTKFTQDGPSPNRRVSVVPKSLQPALNLETADMSVYGALEGATSMVNEFWRDSAPQDRVSHVQDRNPFAHDKITLPIDQSQFIREHAQTSTPTSKNDPENKRAGIRRMSRPSMGGSPTLKLSPITETSRDCNSKSSSSSSANSGTPGTVKKLIPPVMEPILVSDEPERPLDPNDPTTYQKLLVGLPEPLEKRFLKEKSRLYRHNRSMPRIRPGVCFEAGDDKYLVEKELCKESQTFKAQILSEDSNEDSNSMNIRTFWFRVDQPASEWLFYICNELLRRVRQKTTPDIELSIMTANPAIVYNDGSVMFDEDHRFYQLQQYLDACREASKPFPRSVAAYIALELIQVVRHMHSCGVIHMNIDPKNIIITCCPNRDDIERVNRQTSIVKLIGFERAIDTLLLPQDFKFETQLKDLMTCEMRDGKPWSIQVDWYGVLNCIYQMFFMEDMSVDKTSGQWAVPKQFKNCPTNINWSSLFGELLNITDFTKASTVVDGAVEELTTWVKANLSFVLKEAVNLDEILEVYRTANNKSIRP